ncbi:alpha-crystallin A chain-like [Oppia nitens]|uniref:alpha-crystallin A chain-like n=1 Tax=Oppia nitens TaxID=1686743 RepID=UPI0023DB9764|nr:alpha-crystallin A chain-like [Oppia nitens]
MMYHMLMPCTPFIDYWPETMLMLDTDQLANAKPKNQMRRPNDDNRQIANSSQIANNVHKFIIRLDCNHFKPEELEVKTDGKFLKIHGKHDERCDTHGWIAREFTRSYALPDDCDSDTVVSSINSKGILTIEAKKKSKVIEGNEINIKINVINGNDIKDKTNNTDNNTNN